MSGLMWNLLGRLVRRGAAPPGIERPGGGWISAFAYLSWPLRR
ncbi:hypothetical protein EV137_1207 [Kribbella pratensis]|uniref:Uncharacterized protein n=1 Tax=Kribbella pratensis TaxID=2512112 RepID=A0ABY2FMS3_9ACTN|nr:hypothetical protein EV137_1207 [Kribbella pratensis]TDX02518.1 hypothetical protein EV647_0733 [Kribbella sp. VKM Ac-2566]